MSVSGRNKLYTILIDTLRAATLLCATGTLMQTFLSSLGFEEDWIYLHSTLVNAGQICSILLCSQWGDRGNLFRKTAYMLFFSGLLFFFYIPLCLISGAGIESYLLLLAVGLVQAITNGLHTVCYYKLPYYIFEEKDIGIVLSWTGVLSGIVSFLVGEVVSSLSEKVPYAKLMLGGFLLAGIITLFTTLLQIQIKPLSQPQVLSESKEKSDAVPLKSVLLSPVFRNLLVPNLMRGFTTGAITVLPVMALSLGYGQTFASSLVSACSVATLISCGLFGFLNSRLRTRNVIALGSLAQAGLLLMLIPGSRLFLIAYCIIIFGKLLVDNAVPALLLQTVPVKIAGPYNAWRMILHYFGTLLGTAAATVIPIPFMLILSAGMQALSGFIYHRSKVMRIYRNQQEV